jgi:hypothetical protein
MKGRIVVEPVVGTWRYLDSDKEAGLEIKAENLCLSPGHHNTGQGHNMEMENGLW